MNVEVAHGSQPGRTSRAIGRLINRVEWFAIVRHSVPFIGPRHGDHYFHPNKGALLVCYLRQDGLHVVIAALNGVPHVLTTMKGRRSSDSPGDESDDEMDDVVVLARNDGEERAEASTVVTVAKEVPDGIKGAVQLLRGLLTVGNAAETPNSRVVDADLESWYDGLIYCTRHGLGQQLSESKILDALRKLDENGVDVSTLVIDDNWQSLDFKDGSCFDYIWPKFEAIKEGSPMD